MDFKVSSVVDKNLNFKRRFKISIRVSITTLFAALLSIVGISIIAIKYSALNSILISSAKDMTNKNATLVSQRFQLYLSPLDHDLIEARNMVARGIVDPNRQPQFKVFLSEIINNDPNIFGVYWGTVDGDFYGIFRDESGKFVLNHIINSAKHPTSISYELDDEARILNTTDLGNLNYDPRLRSWYQEAVKAGHPIWTDIYSFFLFGDINRSLLGISAATPIYDKNQNLLGVIALDLTLDNIQNFVRKLRITDNAAVFVTDQKNNIIAYRVPSDHENIQGKELTHKLIEQLKVPFPLKSLDSLPYSATSYERNRKHYILAYKPIQYNNIKHAWHITIIIPADDVLAPLKKVNFYALLWAFLCLIAGILITRYISRRISTPIIQLAHEAQAITRLDLGKPRQLKTIIKEIAYLRDSLAAMRNSLASFQRYVPSSLVKKLVSSGKIAKVAGESKEITVLFSDVQNFTQLSEQTQPEQLMIYLSAYFDAMTDIVLKHYGTLDKYIGDAIMAFWNAPLTDTQHALHACKTAVMMLQCAQKLNQEYRNHGTPELNIRIGISTGLSIVGNLGSKERLNYTAIGDNVNLASRLEAINKVYNTRIIVNQTTYEQAKNHYTFRFLDYVAVRGRSQGNAIYELITAEKLECFNWDQEAFQTAFTYYQKGEWEKSLALFEKLPPAYPGDILPKLYSNRCKSLLETPLLHWDGIWRME